MAWVRQQDYDTESLRLHGCGLAAGTNGMIRASGSEWQPGGDGTAFARILKDRSGVTDAEFNKRGVTSRELFTALSKTADDNDERMPLQVKAYHGGVMADMLAKMVEVKGALLVAVKNKVLVKAGKTRFPGFNGGHWGVVTAKVGSDVRWIAGEKSPIVLPIRVLRDAADQFGDNRDVGLSDGSWGDGRGEAILVYPWLTWRDGYAAMKKKRDDALVDLDRALDDLDSAEDALKACQAAGPGEDALAEARAKGIADAAAAAGAVK
jgi:hypothetical protein